MRARVIDDGRGSIVDYDDAFLDEPARRAAWDELYALRALFDRDRVAMYGRAIDAPRRVCAFGDPGLRYRYAGVDRRTHAWPDTLRAVRDRLAGELGHALNYALVNWYEDGTDMIGWHADKIGDLVAGSAIVSLSLGAVRPFLFRDKQSGETLELSLADGSVLWMRGATQAHWKHALPRRRGVTAARLNVTFRHVIASEIEAGEAGPRR